MFLFHRCFLESYVFDEKNSSPEEKESLSSPKVEERIALKIQKIIIEEKTILLNQLKVGRSVGFKIDQEINLLINDKKNKIMFVHGEGEGEISDLSFFDRNFDENEYQEITITLINGFAENLK